MSKNQFKKQKLSLTKNEFYKKKFNFTQFIM